MNYLNIEYMDGEIESYFFGRDSYIKEDAGSLTLIGGDGSYTQRGKWQGFPLHNVRTWWTSEQAGERR